jgi:hypothetical protein
VSDQITRPNADSGTTGEDGIQDRNVTNDSRDSGRLLHTQASRDAFSTGPSDRTKDNFMGGGNDRAGFGFGGGGGGCSLVASQSASPAFGLAYLLLLLAPVALVVARRLRRR